MGFAFWACGFKALGVRSISDFNVTQGYEVFFCTDSYSKSLLEAVSGLELDESCIGGLEKVL